MKRLISQTHVNLLAAAALLALVAPALHAQAIYRVIGPDGQISFSDQPPPASVKSTTLPASGRSDSGASEAGGLPVALRQIVSRYPVTLYTGDNCSPCGSGRSMLTARGVPFTERTVTTQQDVEAFQKLSGQGSLPMLTIGGQQLNGFTNSEWTQYLDAAGYPQSSQLPSGYRNPSPSPLTSSSKPAPAAATQNAAPIAAPPPPAATPDNPAGIRF